MTQLTPHFTLEEFTASQIAARFGFNNDLPADLKQNAVRTCEGLERVRTLLNSNAIHISSGYRCKLLNDHVGSKDTSQHRTAQAADFTCPTYGDPKTIVKTLIASDIPYDQVIYEFDSWVHVSFSDSPRRQALVIDKFGARPFNA